MAWFGGKQKQKPFKASGGTWAYQTKIDGVSSLIEKFIEFPKALNSALKRAGRKANTIILQTMRIKVPKKGKKVKLKRNATFKEAARDLFSTAWATIEAKLKGKKKRKRKPKQYFNREFQAGRTGLLRKSLGGKIGVNKREGTVYAITGPRRKTDGFHGKAYSAWIGKMINVVPSKYAHLVERGHILKMRGKVVGRVPGYPFVRPAFDENKGKIEAITATVLQEELDKQWAKKAEKEAKAAARAAAKAAAYSTKNEGVE